MPEHTPAPTSSRSLYGFFMYIFSKIIMIVYCIWALTPDEYLHFLNIYYYPQKYWATAVPIQFLVGLTIFAFLVYPSSNLMLTVNFDSIKTIHDSFSQSNNVKCETYYNSVNNFCVCKNENKCMKQSYLATPLELKEKSVPHLQELDIRHVTKKLYLTRNKKVEL